MTLAPCSCSSCGLPMYYEAGKLPDYPLCDNCKKILEPGHRVSCDGCPAKRACEEADRRGL